MLLLESCELREHPLFVLSRESLIDFENLFHTVLLSSGTASLSPGCANRLCELRCRELKSLPQTSHRTSSRIATPRREGSKKRPERPPRCMVRGSLRPGYTRVSACAARPSQIASQCAISSQ